MTGTGWTAEELGGDTPEAELRRLRAVEEMSIDDLAEAVDDLLSAEWALGQSIVEPDTHHDETENDEAESEYADCRRDLELARVAIVSAAVAWRWARRRAAHLKETL